MLVAFFESIRYVGHLFPVAVLRIYIGYYYLGLALDKLHGDFLIQPRLAAAITEWLPHSESPQWYVEILEGVVIPHWKVFAYILTYCEFVIAISFLVGFLVRPVSILAIFLSINFFFSLSPVAQDLHEIFIMLFITMLWLGAGRCLGFDYFFYKRQRGLWW